MDEERADLWKKEVLDLIGEIFSTACDRIRNVKKFTKITNRVMGFYLTNDEVFNMSPSKSFMKKIHKLLITRHNMHKKNQMILKCIFVQIQ